MINSRRNFLWNIGGGFGGLAASHMLAQEAHAVSAEAGLNGGLHHPAKVKRIIQLFMTGGASPMDTFDYKPALEKLHGQKLGPKRKTRRLYSCAWCPDEKPVHVQTVR